MSKSKPSSNTQRLNFINDDGCTFTGEFRAESKSYSNTQPINTYPSQSEMSYKPNDDTNRVSEMVENPYVIPYYSQPDSQLDTNQRVSSYDDQQRQNPIYYKNHSGATGKFGSFGGMPITYTNRYSYQDSQEDDTAENESSKAPTQTVSVRQSNKESMRKPPKSSTNRGVDSLIDDIGNIFKKDENRRAPRPQKP